MEKFKAPDEWGTKKQISALENPISEFNARGGMDLASYKALEEHLETEHPYLGSNQWAEIQKQLPSFELMEDPESGQRLRIQRFNWPDDGDISEKTVTFSNMPFSVPADPDHIQYEHYLIARELGTPFVVFENPAYGDSDKLTQEQKKALKNYGSFSPIANSMLGIAGSLGTKKANFIGYSMGSETAAAMAANASEHDIEVENLFVMEGPGVQTHEPIKLARDFMSDANNLKFTWANPIDPVLRETSSLKPSLPRGTLSYGLAMIKGTQKDSLSQAIESQPDMHLTIASSGESKISPPEANNSLFSRLRANYPERFIRRIIIPGEGHAYGDSGQRYASLTRLVLGIPQNKDTTGNPTSNKLFERENKRKTLIQKALGGLALRRLEKNERRFEKIDQKLQAAVVDRDYLIRHNGGREATRTEFNSSEIAAKRESKKLNKPFQEKLRQDLQEAVDLGYISTHDMLAYMRKIPMLVSSPERDRLDEAVKLGYISSREENWILGRLKVSNTRLESKAMKKSRMEINRLSKELNKAQDQYNYSRKG